MSIVPTTATSRSCAFVRSSTTWIGRRVLAAIVLTAAGGCGGESEPAATTGASASSTSATTGTGPEPWSCEGPVTPAGARALGFDILNATETGSFGEDRERAAAWGGTFMDLHVNWTQVETEPGVLADYGDTLATIASVAEAEGLRVSLTLRPIDLSGKSVPSDLEDVRFDDPAFVARFQAFVDFVLGILPPSHLVGLEIGNEIDGYDTSAEPPEFWSDYGAFLFAMNGYVDEAYPGLAVGFTGTLPGLTEGSLRDQGVFRALAEAVDQVGVTYYPLADDFAPGDPERVFDDLDRLTAEFGDKALALKEIGYHTPSGRPDAELDQARFFCNAFRAWDQHPSIRTMTIVRMNDLSEEAARELAEPYGVDSTGFYDYLRTLGLRTYPGSGTDKPAADAVREAAAARGF